MNIGDMRKRITILQITPVIGENGFASEQSSELTTVWAFVSNLYGKEYFTAKAVQAEKIVKFTIRYRPNINRAMKIQFDGKTFDITDIDDIKYRKKYLEIKAVEVIPSGQT